MLERVISIIASAMVSTTSAASDTALTPCQKANREDTILGAREDVKRIGIYNHARTLVETRRRQSLRFPLTTYDLIVDKGIAFWQTGAELECFWVANREVLVQLAPNSENAVVRPDERPASDPIEIPKPADQRSATSVAQYDGNIQTIDQGSHSTDIAFFRRAATQAATEVEEYLSDIVLAEGGIVALAAFYSDNAGNSDVDKSEPARIAKLLGNKRDAIAETVVPPDAERIRLLGLLSEFQALADLGAGDPDLSLDDFESSGASGAARLIFPNEESAVLGAITGAAIGNICGYACRYAMGAASPVRSPTFSLYTQVSYNNDIRRMIVQSKGLIGEEILNQLIQQALANQADAQWWAENGAEINVEVVGVTHFGTVSTVKEIGISPYVLAPPSQVRLSPVKATATHNLKVRDRPSLDSEIIGIVDAGDTVTIVGSSAESKWSAVDIATADGITAVDGYLYNDYLQTIHDAAIHNNYETALPSMETTRPAAECATVRIVNDGEWGIETHCRVANDDWARVQ